MTNPKFAENQPDKEPAGQLKKPSGSADARQERRAAVRARLELAAKAGDSAILLDSAAAAEAASLAELLEEGDGDVQSRYLLGILHWFRCQILPAGEDLEALETAVTMLTQCFIDGVDGLPAQLLTVLAGRASDAAMAMLERALESTDLNVLTTTVDLWRRIVSATPPDHANRASTLSNLGLAQRTLFKRTGERADLDAAIQSGQAAVEAAPPSDPNRPICLSALQMSLQERFECTGELADLDAAIQSGQAAVEATSLGHPERPMYLSDLGTSLHVRFERTGDLADLDAAVEAGRQAARETSSGQRGRARYLSNLGASLRVRFEATGDMPDLEEAVEAGTAAVDAVALGDPDRAGMLLNLANTLLARFVRTGTLQDLDEAVAAGRAAVQAGSPAHREYAVMLSNLSGFLRVRFERAGALQDLDEAVEVGRAAVRAYPVGDRRRARGLSNLGAALELRSRRMGVSADLDAAIDAARAAVEVTPAGSPDRAALLTYLASALRQKFERTGIPSDLDAAIDVGRAALDASRPGDPFRAGRWSNLGNWLRLRFDHTRALADLDAAVEAGQEALRSVRDDHRDRAVMLSNLGHALATRFELHGAAADRDAALTAYTEAAATSSATPSLRIRAAYAGASLTARLDPGQAANLLETAVLLIPEAAPRQLGRSDRQYAIGELAGLAGDAAALALADNSPDVTDQQRATRALQLLEAGRAVLHSQTLDTRSDFTELRERHPELAGRFVELRDLLDHDLDTPGAAPALASYFTATPPSGHLVDERRRLAAELTATVDRIRALDGFASFGLPPSASDLLAQAISGPVVSFNVSRHRSDALLLADGGISSVALPDLTHQAAIEQVKAFHQAMGTMTAPDASFTHVDAAHARMRATLEWLWDAAAEPVLNSLGYRNQPAGGNPWPRIWWAPGGLLGLLPVHAAGYHTDCENGGDARTVMDRVVSSYTPTIRALRHARQRSSASRRPDRALIVAMPTTPGVAGRLSNVPAEVAMLQGRLPCPALLVEPDNLPGIATEDASPLPTKANVLALLPACPIVHFSCHGASNPNDPAKSLLLLHDYQSDPLTVASLAPVDLDMAQLAFLSACRTAFTGTVELIDEAIHLTSAFQLAGFPHVVGTMWEIGDALAVRVADAFYTALQGGDGTIDTTIAANALHQTIRDLRDEGPDRPWLWAAYLHAGA
jgi:hypothetical protein